jgi:hypothetical protein
VTFTPADAAPAAPFTLDLTGLRRTVVAMDAALNVLENLDPDTVVDAAIADGTLGDLITGLDRAAFRCQKIAAALQESEKRPVPVTDLAAAQAQGGTQ